MRKLFYLPVLVLLFAFLTSCNNEKSNGFNVDIQINEQPDGWIIAQTRQDGEWIKLDSAELKNGQVSFAGIVDMPLFYYFTIKDSRNYIPVFIEAGTINVIAEAQNLREASVEGSGSHVVYQKLEALLQSYDLQGRELGQQYREAQTNLDETTMEAVSAEYDQLEKDKSVAIIDFAKSNITSVVAPFTMNTYSYMFELSELESVANMLDESVAESTYTIALNDRIDILKRVEVGQAYIDFALNDPEGNPIPLSTVISGNYVLVDFWASWCGPCRAENPNVVEAYNKFHDKGFDVFGVSFDRDYDKWIEAIENDGLAWTQVSDLKFWGCEAGKLYGVQSIPHSILLDPEGLIIAKNLRGEDLQNKLSELLN